MSATCWVQARTGAALRRGILKALVPDLGLRLWTASMAPWITTTNKPCSVRALTPWWVCLQLSAPESCSSAKLPCRAFSSCA